MGRRISFARHQLCERLGIGLGAKRFARQGHAEAQGLSLGFDDRRRDGRSGLRPVAAGLRHERDEARGATGTAQAGIGGTNSSLTLAAGDAQADDFYVGMPIRTTGGTGAGQTRMIIGYTASSKIALVYPRWSPAPDATTTYIIPICTLWKPIATESVAATSVSRSAATKLHSNEAINIGKRKI